MVKSIAAVLYCCLLPLLSQAQSDASRDSFTVYFFLLEDCKITQAYTDKISDIWREYAGDSIGFSALFPNPVSGESSVAEFCSKYGLPFSCSREEASEKAHQFGVSVTPEVVLCNETRGEMLYRGRIDNMFEKIGERRRVVTSFELEAALHAVRNHLEVPVPRTRAVGCFLPGR
jgi:hypothetical protein